MGPTWGPPGSCRPQVGPSVGPMNLAIWNMSPWQPLLGLLFWFSVFKSRHCNSFEDHAPADLSAGTLSQMFPISLNGIVAPAMAAELYAPSMRTWPYRVRCRYNEVNFLLNPHQRHPIARPLGQDMGYIFGESNSDLNSTSVTAMMHLISWYTGPRYNGTRLYAYKA